MSLIAGAGFYDYRRAWIAGRQEVLRQRLVRIVFVIYWLLIFEGALRKWGFPEFRNVFFFIRVPVTLVLYSLAVSAGRWPKAAWPLRVTYAFAIIGAILIPLQMIVGGYELRYLGIAAYGWINYFFYIPLTFLIAEQFRRQDIHTLVRHTLWIATVAAPLVVLQFYSAPSAVINQGSGLDEASQFKNIGAYMGYVRPNGFFTSTEGQAAFVTSVVAFVMFCWLAPASARPVRQSLLSLATLSALVMITLSQSRGLFFLVAMVLLASMGAGLLTKDTTMTLRAVIAPAALIIVGAVAWPLLFPEAFVAFTSRWVDAQGGESGTFQGGVFGRALYGFYEIFYYLEDTPLAGYLIGLGGNAVGQLGWARLPDAAYNWSGYGGWAEGGWSRNVIELGPWLGIAFVVFRIALVIWMTKVGIRSARLARNPLPLMLVGAFGMVILYGQITGNAANNGYAWMFLGLCLASSRISETPVKTLSENRSRA